ncbi:DUF6156 family protein [Novosphingobium album (ex Hu et al. 2023)]|uniref:DUF6156 family protein n=1 Tax=Novosphingobium album (ex Hu et al. 2023) TaxID=2930093 RepID=A0ABT0AYR5_9SPHN|nr:DUF6156 family protein [Novosphingobium album (ex Hu et al. 2023)]MCJ2177798.1 DUF6156 family protein [Novosphingobium album (ex Hu et al. 2023)]
MNALAEAAPEAQAFRYFVTYSGVDLPFRLVGPIDEGQIANRNTFIRAWFDDAERLAGFDKLVYGEVELSHRYEYGADGALARALVTMIDEDPVEMNFEDSPTG